MTSLVIKINESSECNLDCGTKVKIMDSEKIDISRSFFSPTPIFYVLMGELFYIFTSYQELTRTLKSNGADLVPDSDYMRAYLSFQAPHTSATLFKGIKSLRPGEQRVISLKENSRGIGSSQYWSHSLRENPLSGSELKKTLEEALEKLSPTETVFHISSGLDSSIIAILASRIFREQGKSARLATCLTRGSGAADEVDNAKKLADEIQADLRVYDFTDVDIFEVGHELYQQHLGYPTAHPSHLVEYLLDKSIIASGAKTIVNGKGPDDSLAGYGWHKNNFSSSPAHQKRLTVTDESVVSQLINDSHVKHREELQFWDEHGHELSLRERLDYDARSLTESWNIIHKSFSDSWKVRILSPFMEPTIRDGMFMLSDDKKISEDKQKVFLRIVFADDYPDYILDFAKQGLRLDLSPYFSEYTQEELFEKITVLPAMAEQYFKLDFVKWMISQTVSNKHNFGWQLWSIYSLMSTLTK